MDTFNPVFSFTCFYGGFSFFVYSVTMMILYRRQGIFSGSYFMIYKVYYYYNLITFLNSFVTLRVPQNTCFNCSLAHIFKAHSSENYSNFPLGIFYAISIAMAFIQYSMIFLTSLNRLMMFIYFQKNDKIWKKYSAFIFIMVSFFPFCLIYSVILNRCYYIYQSDIDAFKSYSEGDLGAIITYLLIYMVISMLISAFLNIWTVQKLYEMSNQIRKQDRNLIYMTLVSFLIQFIAFLDTVMIHRLPNDESFASLVAFTKLLQPYVSDLLTLSQPWIFIAFSSSCRVEILKFFVRSPLMEATSISQRNQDD